MHFLILQRASQIRSVPFTGDSSDSDSDCGGPEGGGHHLAASSAGGHHQQHLRHPSEEGCVFRGTCCSRNTTGTTTTTMTSSTSGDMSSLPSPRGHKQLKASTASAHFKQKLHTNHANKLGRQLFSGFNPFFKHYQFPNCFIAHTYSLQSLCSLLAHCSRKGFSSSSLCTFFSLFLYFCPAIL